MDYYNVANAKLNRLQIGYTIPTELYMYISNIQK